MSMFDRFFARLGYIKAQPPDLQAPAWARAGQEAERDQIPAAEDVAAQGELYKKLSWLQIAISVYAQSAASTPLEVQELVGEETKAIKNHPFEKRMRDPNPMQSRFEFLESHFSYRRLTGNSYWWLNRSGPDQEPSEIWIIPSHQVRPVPDGRMFLKGYLYDAGDNTKIPLEPWEVVHFKTWNPLSKYVGLSVVEALAIGGHGDLAAQRYDANFYSKDNAKVPGALAFADPISDPDWKRMKAEIDVQHGGTKRKLMMLRNVGKGGVQWVQMSLSHADMQYLEKRQFTKEEIFSAVAPGLASSIAINANEASGRTGDAVFNARAIYPAHVATAEKISKDILPVYGDNLVATFEDVRHKDRQLELQEMDKAARVMKIDELRKRFWQLDAIGDPRGDLLIAEIGKGKSETRSPEQIAAEDLRANVPPAAAMLPAPQEPAGELPPPETAMAEADMVAQDLAKWERKALKRFKAGKNAACDFASDVLDDDLVLDLQHALQHANSEAAIVSAFKREPGDGLTPEERTLYTRLSSLFIRSGSEMAQTIASGGMPSPAQLASFHGSLSAALTATLTAVVEDRIAQLAADIGPHFESTTLGQDIAGRYVVNYLTGIETTTRQALERAVSTYRSTPGMTQSDLVQLLRGSFGPRRAELIALTSITEAASQAINTYQAQLKEAGIEMERIWRTNADEAVCMICGPLNGQPESKWVDRFPAGAPAHLRCRCTSTLRVKK